MGVADEVGQEVTQESIDHPSGELRSRTALSRNAFHLGEGDFEFIERLVAALVDPWRLAGRPDEAAGKDIRERWVVLPVGDQTA